MNALESTKYRKRLEEGGVPAEQAVAHADALGEVLERLTETLATKDWVRQQMTELKVDLLRWMVAIFIAQNGIFFAAIHYMAR
ncbi:hypothetical protein GTP58_23560 [Duganella sp. CY15W]|uniref:hypothetical protein n=1 Tax=Duganella sp. CY15W TaxID=2692172 RepID=UPI0013689588|nr:hypothetical protein [Duganella sp. CY15W]MYM31318.1 hypothetical protein [Duganella sp. CY15W]